MLHWWQHPQGACNDGYSWGACCTGGNTPKGLAMMAIAEGHAALVATPSRGLQWWLQLRGMWHCGLNPQGDCNGGYSWGASHTGGYTPPRGLQLWLQLRGMPHCGLHPLRGLKLWLQLRGMLHCGLHPLRGLKLWLQLRGMLHVVVTWIFKVNRCLKCGINKHSHAHASQSS